MRRAHSVFFVWQLYIRSVDENADFARWRQSSIYIYADSEAQAAGTAEPENMRGRSVRKERAPLVSRDLFFFFVHFIMFS